MNYTEEISDIQNDLLGEMPDTYSKVKGTWLWEMFKSFSIKIYELLQLLTDTAGKFNVEKLRGDELDAYVKQWTDLERKEAKRASGLVEVYGNGVLYAGTLIASVDSIQYETVKDVEIQGTALVEIIATEAGEIGNAAAGTVINLVTSNANITSVTNPKPIEGGTDEETDEALRERYYLRLSMPATSGNKAHYILWAMECAGVGGAKAVRDTVIPNKVNLYICGGNGETADDKTVLDVQRHIDPNKNGDGSGNAPIGAVCEVFAAGVKKISISGNIEIDNTQGVEKTQKNIRNNILRYFSQINFKKTELSYAKLLDIVINSQGVNDIKSFKINNGYENVVCDEMEVFLLDVLEMEVK